MASLFKFNFTPKKTDNPESHAGSYTATPNGQGIKLSQETFLELRDFIYQLTGMYFNEPKISLLEGRINQRLEELQITSFEEYLNYIKNDENAEELTTFLDLVTINETFFFRSQPQFDAIQNIILPNIIKTKKEGKKTVRIWSAACSTGEEAYTLAIIILEYIKPQFPDVTFQILASDINTDVIEQAKLGFYKDYAIKNTPPHILSKYFKISGTTYVVNDEVKKLVKFNNINLIDSNALKLLQGVDLIICANVLIYFDIESKQKVVSSLYDILNTGGYLFVGYSESLHGISKAFSLVHLPKSLAYKK